MGPSGSGKTTLLNLIGGLDSPTDGSITVGGERIDRLSESALARWRAAHVGFVFQFYNLLPMLSARRNVELPLLLTRLSAAQRRRNADIALQLVGLRGSRRRTSPVSCRAASSSAWPSRAPSFRIPTLLVCDEPTGDLDRQSAAEVLGLLQQLNREHGKTIIMVTHDPKAAEYRAATRCTWTRAHWSSTRAAVAGVKYLQLVLGALFRRKTRTIFTLLSVLAAFLLFGLLDSVRSAFAERGQQRRRGRPTGDRISKISLTLQLPKSLLERIGADSRRGAGGLCQLVRRRLPGSEEFLSEQGRGAELPRSVPGVAAPRR